LQAIENFALTVKEMAQMLQSFGTELAETELPDDIPSIEEILALHTEKYHLLKVCLIEQASKFCMAILAPERPLICSFHTDCYIWEVKRYLYII
jgi:hypothetical protein